MFKMTQHAIKILFIYNKIVICFSSELTWLINNTDDRVQTDWIPTLDEGLKIYKRQ